MKEKLLPIGSVVQVKDIKKKIIIVGFKGKDISDPKRIYDYICYTYPEGFVSREYTILLDHKNIQNVCYLGYSTLEDEEFKNML